MGLLGQEVTVEFQLGLFDLEQMSRVVDASFYNNNNNNCLVFMIKEKLKKTFYLLKIKFY